MNIVRFFLIVSIAFFASYYWYLKFNLSAAALPVERYSTDKVEGVYLSKFQDLRGVAGSLNMQHDFATYLEEATSYIARTTESENSLFNAGYDVPNWIGRNFNTTNVLPLFDDDFFLGFNRTTRFKLNVNPSIELSLTEILEREVELSNEDEIKYRGVVKKINNDEIEIEGYFPNYFFPNVLKVLNQGVPLSKRYMIESNTLGWIRGGVLSTSSGKQVLMIIPMPGDRAPSPDIRKGDVIHFPVIEEPIAITRVFNVGRNSFVELEQRINPYFDVRENIIVIERYKSEPIRQSLFDIANVTDEHFLFGKQRVISVKTAEKLLTNDNVIATNAYHAPLIVNSTNDENLLNIDLLKSLVFQSCLIETSNKVVCSDKVAQLNFETYENISKELAAEFLHSGEFLKTKANIDNAVGFENFTQLDMFEVFNLGGNVKIYSTSESRVNENLNNAIVHKDIGDIWEIYPGSMLNVYYSTHNPAPTELMIHVLGKEAREEYYAAFLKQRPRFVSFAKPERFAPWLINWHWPFFLDLLHNYKQVVSTNEFGLFEISPQLNTQYTANNFIPVSKDFPVKFESENTERCEFGVKTVRVEYQINNPMGKLPVFGRAPRFLLNISNNGFASNMPVSLPWSEESFEFPIFYVKGSSAEVQVEKQSDLFNMANIEIKAISYRDENIAQDKIQDLIFDYPNLKPSFIENCKGI